MFAQARARRPDSAWILRMPSSFASGRATETMVVIGDPAMRVAYLPSSQRRCVSKRCTSYARHGADVSSEVVGNDASENQ